MISPHYYNTNYTETAMANTVNSGETKFREFGVFKGKISVPDDFNEPLDDFNEY